MVYEKEKASIRHELKRIPVRKHFVAVVEDAVIKQFEKNHWLSIPEDYRWFLRHLGQGGVGFETLGITKITDGIHLFHAVLEAKRMEDFVPLRDFLLIEHLSEGDFYYLKRNLYTQLKNTAPVYHWSAVTQSETLIYDNFYRYFLDALQKTTERQH